MRINRRRLLQLLPAAPLPWAVFGISRIGHGAEATRPVLLVAQDLDPALDPRLLQAILEPLQARNVKLGLVVGAGKAPKVQGCDALDPDLVEWIVDQPGIADESNYFQMRQATEAQDAFAGFRAACGVAPGRWDRGLTLSSRLPAPGNAASSGPALDGVRAAGFRTLLLRPQSDQPLTFWQTDGGVLQLQGGLTASWEDRDRITAAVFEKDPDNDPVVAYLSLAGIAGADEATLRADAESFGAVIAAGARDGAVAPMLPSDFHLARYTAARLIGLHIEGAAPALTARLKESGIRFSVSGATTGSDSEAEACITLGDMRERANLRTVLANDLKRGSAAFAAPQTCAIAGDGSSAADLAGTGIAVVSADAGDAIGLDESGLLHCPVAFTPDGNSVAALAAGLVAGRGRLRDTLVRVRGADFQGDAARVLSDALAALARDPGNRIVGLPALANSVTAPDRIFALLQRAKAEDFIAAAAPTEIDAGARAELMQDAALAWRYFQRFTDKRTGLAIATVEVENKTSTGYSLCTMWDIGSQILATIAALKIGLIDQAEFAGRTKRLLASLPATKLNGLVLPQSNVSTKSADYQNSDFRASDTGRLLVALKVLRERAGFAAEVDRAVARWTLAGIVVDGHLSDIEGGRFRDYASSNYVGYAARGFSSWGVDSIWPYAVGAGEKGADRQMRLLYRAAELGLIASEPHVLEALELGASEACASILGVLFAAQAAAFQSTGKYYCVSEASLDRAPWFTYQGFELGAAGDPWSLKTVTNAAEYQTPAFRAAARMVSTKSAYAWAALTPHPYAQALLGLVRSKARIQDLGFASGIYAETGLATAGYSDSNTNGVVLEAIAYLLAGRKPALTPR